MGRTIITVGREYGSGGREIAEKLAEKLEIGIYDKERLMERAKKEGTFESMKSFYEERPIDSLLYAIAMDTIAGKLNEIPFKMIREIAEGENCVIVGRCSNFVLKEDPDVLRVFIHADFDTRVEKISREMKLTKEKAAEKVRQRDRERASFYRFHTEEEWEDLRNYDISLDSSLLGTDGCLEMILKALEFKKTKRS